MVLSFLFYAFLIYLAWQLIFRLVIPLVRATRKIRKGFREMQEQMNGYASQGQHNQQAGPTPWTGQSKEPLTDASNYNKGAEPGDYIEFEETK